MTEDMDFPERVWLGPLEIFIHCDAPGCAAEEIVWEGNPDEEEPTDELPAGWVQRDKQSFCPEHA